MATYCIGIDLGGTFMKFGLLDDRTELVATSQEPTPTGEGGEGVVRGMIAGAEALVGREGVARGDLVGVGIGSPGPLNLAEGRVIKLPNIPGMDDTPLRDRIAEGLGLPAVLENDANAAAFGEYVCGAGKAARDMVMLTLGTGVGSGIILDGTILHGAHDIGGELGHMIVEAGGRPCNCGQRGCLERYCSATCMGEHAERLIRRDGRPSALAGVLDDRGAIDARDINAARRDGDALAEEVWDQAAYFLALGCVNVCRIFDPDRIVLAGGLINAGEDLMGPLRAHFRREHWHLSDRKTTVVAASLGTDAGVIGAAAVAWSAFGRR
jgi:glucokinase